MAAGDARPADVAASGVLAIPQSQLLGLTPASLQPPATTQPSSLGLSSHQQQALAPPIITPSLAPSTQLLFAPSTFPGLVPAAPRPSQPQPPAAAEPIEIIGIDDDEDDLMDELGPDEEGSEGQPFVQ